MIFVCGANVLLILFTYTAAGVTDDEFFALQSLYQSTNGDSWNWDQPGIEWHFDGSTVYNPCSDNGNVWQGIRCSRNVQRCASEICQINALSLPNENLNGNLPSDISSLTGLLELDLSGNYLRGTIPPEIGMLKLERLELYDNYFRGEIPLKIFNMTDLVVLDVEINFLEGVIPSEIGGLKNLNILYLRNNRLEGSIPPQFGMLIKLRFAFMENNEFDEEIPASIGSLRELRSLYLDSNYLTGPIPPSVGDLCKLVDLSLANNALTGSLPGSIGKLTNLDSIDIEDNYVFGSIPSELGTLSSVYFFDVGHNLLSGQIPSELGKMTKTEYFLLYGNRLSGSLPESVGSLSLLDALSFYENEITGNLPSTLGLLSVLYMFKGYSNKLSGPIPSEIGNMSRLSFLYLHGNGLTGSIPSSFGSISKMTALDLSSNSLSGPIPKCIGKLILLEQLFLQRNALTGDLDDLFNQWQYMAAVNIDLSNNFFTGEIPSSLFSLPILRTVALSVNCFRGKLPDNICSATIAMVLSMDGLSAANGCANSANPIQSWLYAEKMEGSIPDCVFRMKELRVLHLTGNELCGQLRELHPDTMMINMSLAYNHLSGTIPRSYLNHSFQSLDLSYNKITGEYSTDVESDSVSINVNRLSGNLPPTADLTYTTEYSLLEGNMFSCDYIPEEDSNSANYVCGSTLLDLSLYAFGAIGGTVFLMCSAVALLIYSTVPCRENSKIAWCREKVETISVVKRFNAFQLLQVEYMWHCSQKDSLDMTDMDMNLSYFQYELQLISWLVLKLAICGAFLCLILVIFKAVDLSQENPSYITYYHMYSWVFSVIFVSGDLAAGLLLTVWCLQLCYFTVLLTDKWIVLKDLPNAKQVSTISEYAVNFKHDYFRTLQLIAVYLFNAFVVCVVYVIYVLSINRNIKLNLRRLIQICVALFMWSYNSFIVPLLMRLPRSNESTIEISYFWVLIFNHILAPAFVIAATSPDCFKNLFVLPDDVSSFYSYAYCASWVAADPVNICTRETINTVHVDPYTPLFSYNHQCAFVILTSFIPVHIYAYLLKLAVPVFSVLAQANVQHIPRPIIHALRPLGLPRLLWVDELIRNTGSDSGVTAQRVVDDGALLNARLILNRLMNDVAMLLTFGLCCPALGAAIAISVIVGTSQWRYLVGRFVKTCECNVDRLPDEEKKILITNLGRAVAKGFFLFDRCLWPVSLVSVLFFSLIAYDMSVDKSGNIVALWTFGVAFFVVPLVVFICRNQYLNYRMKQMEGKIETVTDTLNPLSPSECSLYQSGENDIEMVKEY